MTGRWATGGTKMHPTPDDVVRSARGFLGTRYRHEGRTQAGMDCIGLVLCVARELGLSDWEPPVYGRRPDHVLLHDLAQTMMTPVQGIQPGAVVEFAIDGLPQHFGIAAPYVWGGLSIIHAYAPTRTVVEVRLDDVWRGRVCGVYMLPGVAWPS